MPTLPVDQWEPWAAEQAQQEEDQRQADEEKAQREADAAADAERSQKEREWQDALTKAQAEEAKLSAQATDFLTPPPPPPSMPKPPGNLTQRYQGVDYPLLADNWASDPNFASDVPAAPAAPAATATDSYGFTLGNDTEGNPLPRPVVPEPEAPVAPAATENPLDLNPTDEAAPETIAPIGTPTILPRPVPNPTPTPEATATPTPEGTPQPVGTQDPSKVLLFARNQVGRPYSGPLSRIGGGRFGDPGYDCSSFVSAAYREIGVNLTPFTDAAARETTAISTADARPGDIIFYRYNDASQPNVRFPHMAIYLGNGQMIDAGYNTGVSVRPILNLQYEIHRAPGVNPAAAVSAAGDQAQVASSGAGAQETPTSATVQPEDVADRSSQAPDDELTSADGTVSAPVQEWQDALDQAQRDADAAGAPVDRHGFRLGSDTEGNPLASAPNPFAGVTASGRVNPPEPSLPDRLGGAVHDALDVIEHPQDHGQPAPWVPNPALRGEAIEPQGPYPQTPPASYSGPPRNQAEFDAFAERDPQGALDFLDAQQARRQAALARGAATDATGVEAAANARALPQFQAPATGDEARNIGGPLAHAGDVAMGALGETFNPQPDPQYGWSPTLQQADLERRRLGNIVKSGALLLGGGPEAVATNVGSVMGATAAPGLVRDLGGTDEQQGIAGAVAGLGPGVPGLLHGAVSGIRGAGQLADAAMTTFRRLSTAIADPATPAAELPHLTQQLQGVRAIMDDQGGQITPELASQIAGGATGAAASQLGTDENTSPEERALRLAVGTPLGVGAGTAIARLAGRFAPTSPAIDEAIRAGLEGRAVTTTAAEDLPQAVKLGGEAIGSVASEDALRTADAARPDFAGNIKTSKFLDPTVRDMLQVDYDANPTLFETARRGVMSDEQVRQLASEIDPEHVDQLVANWRMGDTANAETIQALRTGLDQQRAEFQAAQDAYRAAVAGGGDVDAAKGDVGAALAKFQAYQMSLAGHSAEAGRALRVFTQEVDPQTAGLRMLTQIGEQAGRTPDEIASVLMNADLSDTRSIVDAVRAIGRPSTGSKLSWYLYTSLLSNPVGRFRDFVANNAMLAHEVGQEAGAAAVAKAPGFNWLDKFASRTVAGTMDRADSRTFGDVAAMIAAMKNMAPSAAKQAMSILLDGYNEEALGGQIARRITAPAAMQEIAGLTRNEPVRLPLPDTLANTRVGDVATGLIPNWVTRSFGAMDAFGGAMGGTGYLGALAHQAARAEGLAEGGEEMGAFIADFMAHPPPEAALKASQAADASILRTTNVLTNFVRDLKNSTLLNPQIPERLGGGRLPLGATVMPFYQRPINLMQTALKWSPLDALELLPGLGTTNGKFGFTPGIAAKVAAGTMEPGEFLDWAGRNAIADGLFAGLVAMASAGLITGANKDVVGPGGQPSDRAESDALHRTRSEYSILVGGHYVNYQWMPLAPLLSAAATVSELTRGDATWQDAVPHVAGGTIFGMARALADHGFTQGLTDLYDVFNATSEDNAIKKLGKVATSTLTGEITPAAGMLHLINAMTNGTLRQIAPDFPQHILDTEMSGLPGLSHLLPERPNAFGGPETRSPLTGGTPSEDPVEQLLMRLERAGHKVEPTFVPRSVADPGEPSVRLTPGQQAAWQRLEGPVLYGWLYSQIGEPAWERLSDDDKAKIIGQVSGHIQHVYGEEIGTQPRDEGQPPRFIDQNNHLIEDPATEYRFGRITDQFHAWQDNHSLPPPTAAEQQEIRRGAGITVNPKYNDWKQQEKDRKKLEDDRLKRETAPLMPAAR